MHDGDKCENCKDQKDELIHIGNSIEPVRQSAALIQQTTTVKNKDIRKFWNRPNVQEVPEKLVKLKKPRQKTYLTTVFEHFGFYDEGEIVCGIPNVGKSSMINLIRSGTLKLKGKLMPVGAKPGVTRALQTMG